jgi:hypothetical protein
LPANLINQNKSSGYLMKTALSGSFEHSGLTGGPQSAIELFQVCKTNRIYEKFIKKVCHRVLTGGPGFIVLSFKIFSAPVQSAGRIK